MRVSSHRKGLKSAELRNNHAYREVSILQILTEKGPLSFDVRIFMDVDLNRSALLLKIDS